MRKLSLLCTHFIPKWEQNIKFGNKIILICLFDFFLADPNAQKTSLKAILRYNNVRYVKSIGVSIMSEYWNHERQCATVTQKYKDSRQINFEIAEWKSAINRALKNIELKMFTIQSNSHFWQIVVAEKDGQSYPIISNDEMRYLCEYTRKVFIPRFIGRKSFTRIERFNVVLKKLDEFEVYSNRRYCFENINISYYRELKAYMNSKKYSINYFGTIIKIIKQIMAEAMIIDKLHNNQEYLHSSFKSVSQEVDNVYLTIPELEKIYNTEIGNDFAKQFYPRSYPAAWVNIIRSYNIVKNRFIIGAFTGLRMSDFNKINKNNISNGYITVVTEKTDQRIVIPIHHIVSEIISSGFDFSESLSEVKTREYIKDICKFAKINSQVNIRENEGDVTILRRYEKWEKVSSHTARRSFATNAYKAGIPTISIMKITGHTTESSFMKYIKITEEENAEILSTHAFFK